MLNLLKKNLIVTLIIAACIIYYGFLSLQSFNYLLPVSLSESFFFSLLPENIIILKTLNIIFFGFLIFSILQLLRLNNISWTSSLIAIGCFLASPLAQDIFMQINLHHLALALSIWALIIIYSQTNSFSHISLACSLLFASFALTGNYIYLIAFGLAPLFSIQNNKYIYLLLTTALCAVVLDTQIFDNNIVFSLENISNNLKILFSHWAYFLVIILLIPTLKKLTFNIQHPCIVLITASLILGILLSLDTLITDNVYLVFIFGVSWLLALASESYVKSPENNYLLKIFICIFAFSLVLVSNKYLVTKNDNSILKQNTDVYITNLKLDKKLKIYSENKYLNTFNKSRKLIALTPELIKNKFYNNIILQETSPLSTIDKPHAEQKLELINKYYLAQQQIKLSNNIYNIYYPKQNKYTQSEYVSPRYKGINPHNITVSF